MSIKLEYSDLSDFTQGYVDAILFTECNIDNQELCEAGFEDFSDEMVSRIVYDCYCFEGYNKDAIKAACENNVLYSLTHAGHDFWLTRNGHGSGFWDSNIGEAGKLLTQACGFRTNYPPLSVYYGEDDKLYFDI